MSHFEELKLARAGYETIMGFGRHKGQSVKTLLSSSDTIQYCCWLRKTKRQAGEEFFNDEVNMRLDDEIKVSKSLLRQYADTVGKPLPTTMTMAAANEMAQHMKDMAAESVASVEAEREAKYNNEWGAW